MDSGSPPQKPPIRALAHHQQLDAVRVPLTAALPDGGPPARAWARFPANCALAPLDTAQTRAPCRDRDRPPSGSSPSSIRRCTSPRSSGAGFARFSSSAISVNRPPRSAVGDAVRGALVVGGRRVNRLALVYPHRAQQLVNLVLGPLAALPVERLTPLH